MSGPNFSKQHTHTIAGVRIDDLAGQLARAAPVADEKVQLRVHWKRIDCVYITAARAQLGDACHDTGLVLRPRHFSLSDKKSTRLNSSHLGISYAVFCLKKK